MENNDTDTSVKDFQVEKKLLTWCQTALEGYVFNLYYILDPLKIFKNY